MGAYINHRFLYALGAVALLVLIAGGLLGGPAGFRHEPRSAEAATLTEVKKLIASDAAADDEFGFDVAVSGDTAVVGAPHSTLFDLEPPTGAAYVFQRDEGGTNNWGEVQKLTPPGGLSGDQFGTSVAIDGDLIIVGAPFNDLLGKNAGIAYVYERDLGGTDNWGFVDNLVGSSISDRAGTSVAISGLTAIVGAPETLESNPQSAGKARVYERDFPVADHWGERAELNASDGESADQFGAMVALDGDTAFVGAPFEDAGGMSAGAAYVFERDEGFMDNWGEVKKLTASDAEANDFFGKSAVSGDTAFVTGGGASYVFERNQPAANDWGEVKIIGFSILSNALDGDTAVLGASSTGVFERNEGGAENWGQVNLLTPSDPLAADFFGRSVAVSGDNAVVGASGEDTVGNDAGAAYVFDLLAAKPTPTTPPTATPTKQPDPGDTDQDGCTDVAENGPEERFGGRRDYTYFWDFYDVWTHPPDDPVGWERNKVINIFDILGVANRFGAGPTPVSKGASLAEALTPPTSDTGYHRAFDRGPVIGPNSWNRAPADGAINIVDDVMGVGAQFGHGCA